MRKHHRRMAARAIHRAEQRWNGAAKILRLMRRANPMIHAGARGQFILQQRYGI